MSDDADRTLRITDLLLGAAHADGELHGREESAVRALLKTTLKGAALPAVVDARIKGFKPAGFDLTRAAAPFVGDDRARKRKLLELVAAVGDADGVTDSAEDDFLRALGAALGLKPADYADLVLEVEELRDAFETVRHAPPPLPPGAKR
jgi:uncharacterized tellurite resistance protein B-like protein